MVFILIFTTVLYCASVLGYTGDDMSNSTKSMDASSTRPSTVGVVDTTHTIGTEKRRGPIFSHIQYHHPYQKNRVRTTKNWLERAALEYSQNILAINGFGLIGLFLLSAGIHKDRPQNERTAQAIHYDQVDIARRTNELGLDDTDIHTLVTAEAAELATPTGIPTIHFGIILYHHEDLPYLQTTWQRSEWATIETLVSVLRGEVWFRDIEQSYTRYVGLNNTDSGLEMFESTESAAQDSVKIGALDNVPNIVRTNAQSYRTELRMIFKNLIENGNLKSQFEKLEGQIGSNTEGSQIGSHAEDSQIGNHPENSQNGDHAEDSQTLEELESFYGDMLRDECIEEIKKLVTNLTADHFDMDIPITIDSIRPAMQNCRVARCRIANEGDTRDAADQFDRQVTNIMEDMLKDKTIPSLMRIALMSRKTQRRLIYLMSIHDGWIESPLKLQQYLRMNNYKSKLVKHHTQRNTPDSTKRIHVTRAEYESWYREYYHQTDVDNIESELSNDILEEFGADCHEIDVSSFSQIVAQLKSCILDALEKQRVCRLNALKEQQVRGKGEQTDPKLYPDRAFINMMITEIGLSLLLLATPLLIHIGKNPQFLGKCILRSFKLFEKQAEGSELLEMENPNQPEDT